jgi:hypothetical protein
MSYKLYPEDMKESLNPSEDSASRNTYATLAVQRFDLHRTVSAKFERKRR